MKKPVDKWFLAIVIVLTIGGTLIFFSASLGLLARNGAQFSGIIWNHIIGLALGLVGFFLASRFDYKLIKKNSLYIFLASIALTALVFVPYLGFEHGGANRWILIGSVTFQPAEFLKLGFVLYLAAWFSAARARMHSFTYGLVPFVVLVVITAALLLPQPDTGTFVIIFGTGLIMFFISGARWRDIGMLMLAGGAGLGILAYWKPYIQERFLTFLNPALDPLGAGYQIQQSLIAVGAGEIWGRGFGQSIQKFGYLPEPISDSIFAVFAEEFGFIGGVVLVLLFMLFAFRGFYIAYKSPDYFSRLLVSGIVILITGQAFLNIGSMLAVFPLTGLPLPFVSHGGSALLFTLIGAGIVLNVSRYIKT